MLISQRIFLETIKKWDDKPVTEVHITGGVIPKQDLKFYTDLFKKITLIGVDRVEEAIRELLN